MSLKNFFMILTVAALLFGLGDVLAPRTVNAVFGLEPSHAIRLITRMLGSALLGLGIVYWFAREFDDAPRKSVLLATSVAGLVGAIVSFFGLISGAMNFMGWLILLLYLFAGAGGLYFYLPASRKPS
jgi:uncharacterized BrkB/YihY/UPF0761 family membrane protein